MGHHLDRSQVRVLLVTTIVILMGALTVMAESTPLDRFNIGLEASLVDLTTGFRLDSSTGDRGTSLTFEDDLGLDPTKSIPSLSFEWTLKGRHQLGLRWQDISRKSSNQALTEIQVGDHVIQVNAEVELIIDHTEFGLDYTFFPWIRPRSATGIGLGLRVIVIDVALTWRSQTFENGEEGSDGTGPLPYLFVHHTHLFGDHWRLNARAGWLDASVSGYKGHQWVGRGSIEYLLGDRWSLGLSSNYSEVDIDWDERSLQSHVDLDIFDISFITRFRW